MTPDVLFPLAAIGISIIGLLFQHFAVISKLRESMSLGDTKLQERLSLVEAKVQDRLARLETKVDLWWRTVEREVAPMLKQPSHQRKDDLLDKMAAPDTLTLSEAKELESLLAGEFHDSSRDNLRLAYILVLGRLRGRIAEMEMR